MNAGRQHLVCLATSAASGGAETSLLTLLRALKRIEPAWDMTVVAPSAGPLLDGCRALGAAALALPYPPALDSLGESITAGRERRRAERHRLLGRTIRAAVTLPRYVSSLRRLLRGSGATVVHTNGVKAHIAAALSRPAGVRLVWHLHEYVQARPVTMQLLRRFVHRADAVVANSDSVRADAATAFGGAARVRRIYNAVDPDVFRPEGSQLDLARLSGLPADGALPRIGLVATFARWKGHEVFIDAVGRLVRTRPVRAYIVGSPVYATAGSQWTMAELKARVDAAGLSAAIGFTGQVGDVPSAMRALDVVVHASTRPEPFGMVIGEAMAAGRALVAARAGGAAELFVDRVDALGHAPGSAEELAARLDELVSSPSLRARLGCEARRAACARFAPARMAAEFREAYLE
jgi:glycosyltransferase involved in cell wall biosynthesis